MKRRSRLLEAAQEIDDWKAGKSKATILIDGKAHEMTIDEWLAHRSRSMSLTEQIKAGDFDDVPDEGNCCAGRAALKEATGDE